MWLWYHIKFHLDAEKEFYGQISTAIRVKYRNTESMLSSYWILCKHPKHVRVDCLSFWWSSLMASWIEQEMRMKIEDEFSSNVLFGIKMAFFETGQSSPSAMRDSRVFLRLSCFTSSWSTPIRCVFGRSELPPVKLIGWSNLIGAKGLYPPDSRKFAFSVWELVGGRKPSHNHQHRRKENPQVGSIAELQGRKRSVSTYP